MKLKKLTQLQILGLFLAFLAIAGLFYWFFVEGYLPGIFPFALAYATVGGVLFVLSVLIMGFLWQILTMALLILGVLALYTRRRIYRRACLTLGMLPCLAILFLPASIYFDPGPSLVVEPWGQQYRVVFAGPTVDPDYGDLLVFQRDRSGITRSAMAAAGRVNCDSRCFPTESGLCQYQLVDCRREFRETQHD